MIESRASGGNLFPSDDGWLDLTARDWMFILLAISISFIAVMVIQYRRKK